MSCGSKSIANRCEVLERVYPIGSVYTNASSSENPTVLLGFGTWSSIGSGRMLIGRDSGDTSFDTLGETGGSKTATLAVTNLPAHNHNLFSFVGGGAVTTVEGINRTPASVAGTLSSPREYRATNTPTDGTGDKLISDTGSGTAFSIVNPYFVVQFWVRVG